MPWRDERAVPLWVVFEGSTLRVGVKGEIVVIVIKSVSFGFL